MELCQDTSELKLKYGFKVVMCGTLMVILFNFSQPSKCTDEDDQRTLNPREFSHVYQTSGI
jgi:hypothetical protein